MMMLPESVSVLESVPALVTSSVQVPVLPEPPPWRPALPGKAHTTMAATIPANHHAARHSERRFPLGVAAPAQFPTNSRM